MDSQYVKYKSSDFFGDEPFPSEFAMHPLLFHTISGVRAPFSIAFYNVALHYCTSRLGHTRNNPSIF